LLALVEEDVTFRAIFKFKNSQSDQSGPKRLTSSVYTPSKKYMIATVEIPHKTIVKFI
jgi:hypothetical protein